jgi:molybdopterin synthase sulfur carrier subunit
MARVFIPAQWRDLSGGVADVVLPGSTLRAIVDGLERKFPGVAERLCPGGEIAPGLAVSIDGSIASRGLAAAVGPDSELHILPAIGGG